MCNCQRVDWEEDNDWTIKKDLKLKNKTHVQKHTQDSHFSAEERWIASVLRNMGLLWQVSCVIPKFTLCVTHYCGGKEKTVNNPGK